MEKDDVDALFLQWLSDNGAKFPKIDWPSSKTDSGIRGAIATNTIETNEPMIVIPGHLMMSPPIIFADPDIGQLLKMAVDVLHGDLLLAVYIMFECQKKGKSFYYPFLRILPEPGNVSEWTEEQLSWLQDDGMLLRAKGRQKLIKVSNSPVAD